MKHYKVVTMSVSSNGAHKWSAMQTDFYNQGTKDVFINGRLLPPNSGFGFVGFPGEIDVTIYNVQFETNEDAGNNLIVTTKEYC